MQDDKNKDDVVVCRPDSSLTFLSIICVVMGLMLFASLWLTSGTKSSGHHVTEIGWAILGAMIGIAGLFGLFYAGHARSIADNNGLRLRRFGTWKFVPWERITDYYDAVVPNHRTGFYCSHIIIDNGIIKHNHLWTNGVQFRAMVSRYACNAAAHEWQVLGTRAENEWPRIFEYKIERSFYVIGIMQFLVMIALFWMTSSHILRDLREIGAAAFLYPLGGLLLCSTFGLLFLAGASPIIEFRRHRRSHSISVDTQSITFYSAIRDVHITWDAIRDYYIASLPGIISIRGRYVVVTEQGEFDFTSALRDAIMLKEIIRVYAKQADVQAWEIRHDDDNLADVIISPEKTGSTQVYHFRTRTNRILLGILGFYAFCPAFMAFLTETLGDPLIFHRNLWLAWYITIFVCVFVWSLWRYRVATVRVTEEAIIKNDPLRTVSILWTDVSGYSMSQSKGTSVSIVTSHTKTLKFSRTIAHANDLEAEIRRRAVNCVDFSKE